MAGYCGSVLVRSRHIATTAGWSRRIAIVMAVTAGALVGVARFHEGSALGASILSGALWTAVFVPFAIYAVAQNHVIGRMLDEPRPARSLADAQATASRMQVATWVMAIASLILSVYALLK